MTRHRLRAHRNYSPRESHWSQFLENFSPSTDTALTGASLSPGHTSQSLRALKSLRAGPALRHEDLLGPRWGLGIGMLPELAS